MAASRFDARKALIQEEVNAIRTAYLRAQFLPSPQRQEISDLLRAYVAARIEFMRAGTDHAQVEAANASAYRIEVQLWTLAGTVEAQNVRTLPAGLFIQALNEIINVNERRLAALDNHVPQIVVYLLLVVATGSLGFIAYSFGLRSRHRHGSSVLFAVLIAMVFTIILDMDRPRSGIIRVNEDTLVRLKETLDRNT